MNERRHVHHWCIYTPAPIQQQLYFEFPLPKEHDPWTYRRCDCGAKMRCLTEALASYPSGLRAFANESWQDDV